MAYTFDDVWAALMETRQQMKETDNRMKETDNRMKEFAAEAAKRDAELNKQIARTNKQHGDFVRRFGEVIEHMIAPNLAEKFNKLGYNFNETAQNLQFSDGNHKVQGEIDILLANGDFSLVVEVKTKPTTNDFGLLLQKLERLQKYPVKAVRGTKILAAFGGMVFTEEVAQLCYNSGIYIVKQTGDNINIEVPENFQPKYF